MSDWNAVGVKFEGGSNKSLEQGSPYRIRLL